MTALAYRDGGTISQRLRESTSALHRGMVCSLCDTAFKLPKNISCTLMQSSMTVFCCSMSPYMHVIIPGAATAREAICQSCHVLYQSL